MRTIGEYGDNTARPHYHAILFNYCPEDFKPGKDMLKLDPLKFDNDWSQLCSKVSVDYSRLFSSVSSVGSSARHSRLLSDCWGNGSVMVGEVTFESCAYTNAHLQPLPREGIFIITRLPGVTLRSPPAVYWPPLFPALCERGRICRAYACCGFPSPAGSGTFVRVYGAMDYMD